MLSWSSMLGRFHISLVDTVRGLDVDSTCDSIYVGSIVWNQLVADQAAPGSDQSVYGVRVIDDDLYIGILGIGSMDIAGLGNITSSGTNRAIDSVEAQTYDAGGDESARGVTASSRRRLARRSQPRGSRGSLRAGGGRSAGNDPSPALEAISCTTTLVLTGTTTGSVDSEGGALASPDASRDVFVVRLDANGEHLASSIYPGPNIQSANETADCGDDGTAIIAGQLIDSMTVAGDTFVAVGTNPDAFIARVSL